MSNEKSFDAVKFKRKLQENAWKNSGARNLHEYIKYANKVAANSSHK